MQKAYISALYELMQKDKNVVSLLSDSGTDYDVMLSKEFPSQCYNFGIAEQNKVAAASGMAALGKIPFVYTTGAFIAYRAFEFVRNDVCFQNRNVKLMGMGMGMGSWSTLGASHHATEDIAALRAVPNLTLLSASTPIELQKCVFAAYDTPGPFYIRMGMSGEEELFDDSYKFKLGKLSRLLDGNEFTLFTTGTIAAEVLRAARRLSEEGASISVDNVHTIKPIDRSGIIEAVRRCKKIFTVEEHNINGGLGSALAEIIAEIGLSIPLIRIGLNDCFARGYGTTYDVRRLNRMDADSIYEVLVKEFLFTRKIELIQNKGQGF
jgi:transketolase